MFDLFLNLHHLLRLAFGVFFRLIRRQDTSAGGL
jgi:hypothetical protein